MSDRRCTGGCSIESKTRTNLVPSSPEAVSMPYLQRAPTSTTLIILDPDSKEWKARERALGRKIDIRLMPMVVFMYILNYLVRNAMAIVRDNGLNADLKLTDSQYALTLCILYIGYITFQIPSNMLMTKFGRPSTYIATFFAVWAILSGCTGATIGFASLFAVRLCVGVAEAVFFPGALALLGYWYKKEEMATRVAILFSGSMVSNAVSGLISAGIISGMNGKCGITGWRWVYIIQAAVTVITCIVAAFVLPDMPGNSKFISPEEREMAVQRMAIDSGSCISSGEEKGSALQGFYMAIKDVKVWILAFMLLTFCLGIGFCWFFPTIVGSLGYSPTITLLLTAPFWFWVFIACVVNGLHSDRTQERAFHTIAPLVIGMIGFVFSCTTSNTAAKFVALFMQATTFAGFVCVLGWIAPSVPSPTYKKGVAVALVNGFSQLGNITSCFMWPQSWGPTYWKSYTISGSMLLLGITLVMTLRMILIRENKELDSIRHDLSSKGGKDVKETEDGSDPESGDALTMAEKSRQIKIAMAKSGFRYML